MQTEVVRVDAANPDVGEIKRAAGVVDAGGLVGFPTETVYGIACRVEPDSLAKLDGIKGRDPEKTYSLHIGDRSAVTKYVPTVGVRARKLIERAWPGPLTVVFELSAQDVKEQRKSLGIESYELLYRHNSIGIRCPANVVASMLLREVHSAVVAPSANVAGQQPAVNGEEVLRQFSGQIELVLDAGPCKYSRSSTVVRIGKRDLDVLRSGVYSELELEAMSQVSFLFVCTGNTCRSPMAEGMLRKYLAEKLGCEVDALEKVGYKVLSAGVIDAGGFPPSAEAIAACAAKGIDIRAHKSRALCEDLIKESDFIFAMCRMHCEHVAALSREAANRCVLLAEDDIADPIGQSQDDYNNLTSL
ncbi:MAG: L-threonylcarbamoyladenylate synthase [Planctomycetota bacterium]|jgi:tRNA threonylcarbamoyl adenosine modification protein (Sua5/YciO/YrdC/YwlC family)